MICQSDDPDCTADWEILPTLVHGPWLAKLALGWQLPFIVEVKGWGAGYPVILLERPANGLPNLHQSN